MVAVMEQADVPALAQALQKAQQGPRAFRELEAQHPLISPRRRMATDGMAHVQLGQLVVGQVQHAVALLAQAGQQLLARVVQRVGLHPTNKRASLPG